jgi:transcriptional regulator with XRE-family HTH domain
MLPAAFSVKTGAKSLVQFSRNLTRLRSRSGLTQEQLAEKADIHARYLQKLEAGAGHPSLSVLCQLKKALRCRWDELLDKIDSP